MKKILLLFLLIRTSTAYSQPKSYDYCYTNSKGTCVYSVADKSELVVVRGVSDPCLSPDGTKLAYTYNTKDGGRGIKIIDINTKKKTILNTQSDNCYGPVWSPDGRMIAYNVFDTQKSNWDIAVIDTGNTRFKLITHKLQQCYAPAWNYNNKSIIVQDLDNVYIFDLSGNIINTYTVSGITNTLGPSSSNRFILSNDGKKIIFSSSVDEIVSSDGPPSALFIYDIATKTTKRLTPKGYYVNGIFLNNDKILFNGGKVKSQIQNIYTVNPDGSNLKLLFPNCSYISAKN